MRGKTIHVPGSVVLRVFTPSSRKYIHKMEILVTDGATIVVVRHVFDKYKAPWWRCRVVSRSRFVRCLVDPGVLRAYARGDFQCVDNEAYITNVISLGSRYNLQC